MILDTMTYSILTVVAVMSLIVVVLASHDHDQQSSSKAY
jgi:hypothetical protein